MPCRIAPDFAFEKQKKLLIEQYGEKKFDTAYMYGTIIVCENDLYEIKRIIGYMEKYGDDTVAYAFSEVKKLSEQNSKRGMGYITAIVQKKNAE